jgi:DNA-binding beta-propeller fold protein YncE
MVRPVGEQIPLETLPLGVRMLPGGKEMVILQSGYNKPRLSLHRTVDGAALQHLELRDSFHGLVLDGNTVYVGGGTTGEIFEFVVEDGKLEPKATHSLSVKEGAFIGDVALSPDRRQIYAADIVRNVIYVYQRDGSAPVKELPTVRMPYRISFHPSRKEFLVTSWSDAEVARHSFAGEMVQRIAVGSHPTDLVWQAPGKGSSRRRATQGLKVFVSAAHTNDVFVLTSGEDGSLRELERISVSLSPRQPVGMTPSALTLSADGRRLFIACSDGNAVAVADVADSQARVLGFLPAGWYPTETAELPDGRLLILNGKGLRSFPNPRGPNYTQEQRQMSSEERRGIQHVGRLQVGGMSIVAPIRGEDLADYTRMVYQQSPYRDELLADAGVPAGNPIPTRIGDPSPIKHVIYIVKENRTYDQVFGDLDGGNGDPSLMIFPESCSVNHRRLAKEFVLFDNFYVNGDVSADGHNWSAGAISPDFTNKLYPNLYSGRRAAMSLYWGRPPVNHTEDASRPHSGYLWTRAFETGISVRNFGWLTKNVPNAKTGDRQIGAAESKQLMDATNLYFRGYDVSYPDVERMQFFLEELAEWERAGTMPRLIVMRLGNDHTAGFSAGAFTPQAMFADNDLAMAQLIEAVSKSRFWPQTAIFVLEDDAQAGPDHVDAHRSIALIASPYAKRGYVDHNFYNTVSMLRTMELILGLPPMTQFDAAAVPMFTAFTSSPDFTPYTLVEPSQSRFQRNPSGNRLAARSAQLDFSEADRIDDQEMNDILYLGIQGRNAPAPRRSIFYPGATVGEDENADAEQR